MRSRLKGFSKVVLVGTSKRYTDSEYTAISISRHGARQLKGNIILDVRVCVEELNKVIVRR